jgi:hypothetical protein
MSGLLCVHLLRAFMHLQVEKIPSKYILQRYTVSSRQDVPFERNDKSFRGKDGVTKSYRQKNVANENNEGCSLGVYVKSRVRQGNGCVG